ncbi:MAG: hypothetical protein ACM3WU_10635 [Bacillota bacterium]
MAEGAVEPVPDLFGKAARTCFSGIVRLGDRMVTLMNLQALVDVANSVGGDAAVEAATQDE